MTGQSDLLLHKSFGLPVELKTENIHYILSLIHCHVWNSQALIWSGSLVSIWNLVLIAIEIFVCAIQFTILPCQRSVHYIVLLLLFMSCLYYF